MAAGFLLLATGVGCHVEEAARSPYHHTLVAGVEAVSEADAMVVGSVEAWGVLDAAPDRRPRAGDCSLGIGRPTGGRPDVDLWTVEVGEVVDLEWSESHAQFVAQVDGGDRDFSWRRADLQATRTDVWVVSVEGAIEFGGLVHAWVDDRLDDGSLIVRWDGEYLPEEVAVRVPTGGGSFVCPAEGDRVVVPWWLVDTMTGPAQFAATRTEETVDDGVLVRGLGVLVVPLESAPPRAIPGRAVELPANLTGPRRPFRRYPWIKKPLPLARGSAPT